LAAPSRLAGLINHGSWQMRFANVVIRPGFMAAAACIISIWLIAYVMPITLMVPGFMSG
jgi:hypothetical protein